MNKSLGLLKCLIKKNLKNRYQTMEVNRSNRYSPTKKPKNQIFSNNKLNQANFNTNIEKKKYLYHQSLQKFDKINKHRTNQNNKNLDINRLYKNNMINGNNIQNNYKNSQNNSKTINNSKNKNHNLSLQKKIGSKSYADLFQINKPKSNDCINMGPGRTISNSLYDRVYDFEINNSNSNDYNNIFIGDLNNIINILLKYINTLKNEYEKMIIKKVQNKDKEIKKLQSEKEFLIKENKNLKYTILEILYCVKKYDEKNNDKNKDKIKNALCIKQLINENIYLRQCSNKVNDINKTYYIKLENDIQNQLLQKELLIQTKNEEEKNNQINNNEKEENNGNNNPFKFINNNNNSNSKINHKRQKTQFKLDFSGKNENNNKVSEEDKLKNNKDILSGYINIMNNKSMLKNKGKNSSQKNLLLNKNNKNNNINNINNTSNKNEEEDNSSINKDNNLTNSSNNDSVIHNKEISNDDKKENIKKDKDKDNNNKILQSLNYYSSDDKYIQRIEFTK